MHRLHLEPSPSPSSSPAQRDQFARRAAFYTGVLRSRELRDLSEAKSLSNQPNKHLSKRSLQRSRARGRKRNKLDEELLDPGTVHDAASGWHHRDNKLDEVNERVGQQAHILAEEIWRERHGYMRDGIRSRARDEYEAKLAVQASGLKVEHAANLEEVRAMHAAQLKADSNALAAARRALCAAQLECMREREAAEAARAALATAEVAAREERAAAATLELAHQHRDAQHERERAESRTVSTIDTTLAAAAASASSKGDAEAARLRASAAALRRQREIAAAVAHEVELELAQQCCDAQREREAESRTASTIDTAAPVAAAASASSEGDADAARLRASAAALQCDTADKMCAAPAHQPAHRDVIVSHLAKGMDTFSVPTGACVFNLIEMISWRWGVHVSTLRLRDEQTGSLLDGARCVFEHGKPLSPTRFFCVSRLFGGGRGSGSGPCVVESDREKVARLAAEITELSNNLANSVTKWDELKLKYEGLLRVEMGQNYNVGQRIQAQWKSYRYWLAAKVISISRDFKIIEVCYIQDPADVHHEISSAQYKEAFTTKSTIRLAITRVRKHAPRKGRKANAKKIEALNTALRQIQQQILPRKEKHQRRDAVSSLESKQRQHSDIIASMDPGHAASAASAVQGRATSAASRSAASRSAAPPAEAAAAAEDDMNSMPNDRDDVYEKDGEEDDEFDDDEKINSIPRDMLDFVGIIRTNLVNGRCDLNNSPFTRKPNFREPFDPRMQRRIKLIVWDPQQHFGTEVVGKTPCPNCGGNNTSRHGFTHRPRCVYGVRENMLLLGGLYRCKDCQAARKNDAAGKKRRMYFHSYDERLKGLWTKRWLVHKCPVRVSHRAAVTVELQGLIETMRTHSSSAAIAQMLAEMHDETAERALTAAMQFEEDQAPRQDIGGVVIQRGPMDAHFGQQKTSLLDLWKDPTSDIWRTKMTKADMGFGGAPSPKYVRYIYRSGRRLEQQWELQWREQFIVLKFASADWSRKAGKGLNILGTKVGSSSLTLMNGLGMIALKVNSTSETMTSGAGALGLKACAQNQRARNMPPIVSIAMDNPAADGPALTKVFGLTHDAGVLLTFPVDRITVVEASDTRAVDAALDTLRASFDTSGSEPMVLGLDAEWVVTRIAGVSPHDISLVQLASQTCCVLIRLIVNGARFAFPSKLKELLRDVSIRKVGRNVKADSTKLKNQWGCTVTNVCDIADVPNSQFIPRGKKTLENFTFIALNRSLPKDPSVRLSDWESSALSAAQIKYAALDAYASLCVYRKSMGLPVDIAAAPEQLSAVLTASPSSSSSPLPLPPSSSSSSSSSDNASVPRVNLTDLQPSEALLKAAYAAIGYDAPVVSSDNEHVAVEQTIVHRALEMILAFKSSNRRSPLRIPCHNLSKRSRQVIHAFANDHTLSSETEKDADALPLYIVLKCVPSSSSGASASASASSSTSASSASSSSSSREPTSKTAKQILAETLGLEFDWRERIQSNWALTPIDYDSFHWLANFLLMAHGKTTQMFRYFARCVANALFIPLVVDGKTDKQRWRDMLVGQTGWDDDRVNRLPRKYWHRGRCRFIRPSPSAVVESLITIVNFFSQLTDPESNTSFLSRGWKHKFKVSVSYVLKGWLSDNPDAELYLDTGKKSHGLTIWRVMRSTSQLEGYHQHYRLMISACALTMLPQAFDLLAQHFDFKWSVKAGRKFRIFSNEVNASKHYKLYLLDEQAASVERMDYYKPGERPLARHVMVKDELVTVHHGHYYEAVHLAGTAAAANLGAAMAKADLSGNEWVTHLYGDAPSDRKAWTSEVSAADVKWLCSQPELWKDARAMMKAARSRGIFRDKTAWSAFIEQKLKDDIVWKLLKKEGYLEVHRKLRKTSTAGTRFSQAAATKFTITRAKTDEQKRSRPVYDYERRIKRKMEAHGMTRADAVAADRVNFGAPPKAKLPKAKKKKKKTSTKKSKKKKKKSKKKSKKRKGAPAPTAATAASAATAAGASFNSSSRKRSRNGGGR